jgi:hypothetical protein
MSTLLPCVVVSAWVFTEHSNIGSAFNGYLGLFLVAFLYIATVMGLGAGFICGIVALLRPEENKPLAMIGLVLNLVASLWFLNGMKWL